MLKILFCFLSLFSSAHAEVDEATTHNLVTNALSELGPSAVETRNFEAEAMSVSNGLGLFLKKGKGQKTLREVDRDKLKGFVKFFSPDTRPVVCVSVRTQPGCENCKLLKQSLFALLNASLKRRGFSSKPITVGPDTKSAESLFEMFGQISAEEGCAGLLITGLAPSAEKSPDKANEIQSAGFFRYKNFKNKSSYVLKAEPSRLKTESEKFGHEIFLNLAIDLYAKAFDAGITVQALKAGAQAREGSGDSRYLRFDNVSTFHGYVSAKKSILSAIDGLKLEERFLSPGSFRFAVSSEHSSDDLVGRIRKIGFDAKRDNNSSDGDEIVVHLK